MAAHREQEGDIPKLYCTHCHRKIHDIHKIAPQTSGGKQIMPPLMPSLYQMLLWRPYCDHLWIYCVVCVLIVKFHKIFVLVTTNHTTKYGNVCKVFIT